MTPAPKAALFKTPRTPNSQYRREIFRELLRIGGDAISLDAFSGKRAPGDYLQQDHAESKDYLREIAQKRVRRLLDRSDSLLLKELETVKELPKKGELKRIFNLGYSYYHDSK